MQNVKIEYVEILRTNYKKNVINKKKKETANELNISSATIDRLRKMENLILEKLVVESILHLKKL